MQPPPVENWSSPGAAGEIEARRGAALFGKSRADDLETEGRSPFAAAKAKKDTRNRPAEAARFVSDASSWGSASWEEVEKFHTHCEEVSVAIYFIHG